MQQPTTAYSSDTTAHLDLKRLLREKALSLPSNITANGSPPLGVKGKVRPNPYIAHTDERLFVVDRNNVKHSGYGGDRVASNATTTATTSDSRNSIIITNKDILALAAVPIETRPRKLKLIAAVMLILLHTDSSSSSSSSSSEVPSDLSVDAFLWKLLGGRNSIQRSDSKSSSHNNNSNNSNCNSNNDDDTHFLDRLNELPRNVTLIPKFKIIAIKPFIIIILKERPANQGLDDDAITSIGKFVDLITLFVQKIKYSRTKPLNEDTSNVKAEKDRDIINIKSNNNNNSSNNINNNIEIDNGESAKEKVINKIWPISSEILDCGKSSPSQTLLLSLVGDSSMIINIRQSNGNSNKGSLLDGDSDRRRKQLLDLMKRPISPGPANIGMNRPQSAYSATANIGRAAQFNRNTTSCNFFRHETVPIEGASSAPGSTSPGKIEGVDLADFDYVTMNRGVTEYWNTGKISPSKQNVAPTFPHSKVKSSVPLSVYKDMSRERPKSSNRARIGEQQQVDDVLTSTRPPSLTKVFENDLANSNSSSSSSVKLVYAGRLVDDPASIGATAQSPSLADETNDDARINSNAPPAIPDFIKSLEIRIYDPQTSLKDTLKVVEYYEYFHQYKAHLLKSCGAAADNTVNARTSELVDSPKFWSDFIKHTLVVAYIIRKPHQPKQLRVRISREGFRRLVEACAKHSGDAEAFTLNLTPEVHTGVKSEGGTGQSRFQAALKQKVVAAASNLHSTSTPNLAVNNKLATRPSTAGNSRATSKRLNDLRKGEEGGGEELSDAQIEQVAAYLHSCCRIESSNDISLLELEAAFRRSRFAAISKLQDEFCRGLMEKLSHMLSETKLTVEGWFNFSDIKGAGLTKASIGRSGDRKVTHLELIDSISKLCKQHKLPEWSKDDILKLLRYMDPSGDSDVTLLEAELAFRNFHAPPEYLDTLNAATPLVGLLEAHMQRKRIRVVDLYRQVDTDNSNYISIVELEKALLKMFDGTDIDGDGDINLNGTLTSQQVAQVAFYIKSCCRDDVSTEEVTLLELETAFRRYRLVKVNREKESYCRDLMGKLDNLLSASKLTIKDWFNMSDVKGAGLKKETGLMNSALKKDILNEVNEKEEGEGPKQKGVVVQVVQADKETFQESAITGITTTKTKEDNYDDDVDDVDDEAAEIRRRNAEAEKEGEYKRKADADAELTRRKAEFDAHNKKLMEEAEEELIRQAAEIEAKNKSNTELKVMSDRLAAMEEQIRIRKAEKEAEFMQKKNETEAANRAERKAEKNRKKTADAVAEVNRRNKVKEDEVVDEVPVEDEEYNNDFHNVSIKTLTAVAAKAANITPSSISDSNYENDFEEAFDNINAPTTNAPFGDKGVVVRSRDLSARAEDADACYEEVPDYEEVYDEEVNNNSNNSKVVVEQEEEEVEVVEDVEEEEEEEEEEEAGPAPLKRKQKDATILAESGIIDYLFETSKADHDGYRDEIFDEDDSYTEERLKTILHK